MVKNVNYGRGSQENQGGAFIILYGVAFVGKFMIFGIKLKS